VARALVTRVPREAAATVPPDTTADIRLPDCERHTVGAGTHTYGLPL
jgi:hypothetical protein